MIFLAALFAVRISYQMKNLVQYEVDEDWYNNHSAVIYQRFVLVILGIRRRVRSYEYFHDWNRP